MPVSSQTWNNKQDEKQYKQDYMTKIVYKSLSPNWSELFNFALPSFPTNVQIRVFDKDRFSRDDPLGQTTIDCAEGLDYEVPQTEPQGWYDL